MGMIATYLQTTDADLETLKSMEDLLEENEDAQEDEDLDQCDIEDLDQCDIGKMWDALHFLLTGKPASEPIENDLISEAIVGQTNVFDENLGDFASAVTADRVREISAALEALDFRPFIEKFDMNDFAENHIYPAIWGYKEEEEYILDHLTSYFEDLKTFYQRMAEKGCAVFVSIC